MTTIILTIIGILLAAAAALMVIFYGGDAFNAGSIGAQANTYQNAGTNVIAAVQLAKADNFSVPASATTDLERLTSLAPEYLQEVPALANGSDVTFGANMKKFTAKVVSDNAGEVCARINTNLKNSAAGATAPATEPSNTKMSCFGDATAGYTFAANI